MLRHVHPVVLAPGQRTPFPDPTRYDDEGLVAVGGDLSPERLMAAYRAGIFPWYSDGHPPLWWCPNPRAVIDPSAVHVARSMRRRLRDRTLRITWNAAFSLVVSECASERDDGTWILPEVMAAYTQLHKLGHAHSIEVWRGEALIGGLYGVGIGAIFAAESMFHRERDGSKVALLYAAASLYGAGVQLIDVQFLTPHLSSLGAHEIERSVYLRRLAASKNTNISLFDIDLLAPV